MAELDAAREVSVAYTGHAGCPSAATFSAGLRRLMPRLSVISKRSPGADLEVVFERRDEVFIGRVTHGETTREVTAAICADAAFALAVITAISLDPEVEVEGSHVAPEDFVEAEPRTTPLAEGTALVPPSGQVSQLEPSSVTRSNEPPAGAAPRVAAAPQSTALGGRGQAVDEPKKARQWSLWVGPSVSRGDLGYWAWGGAVSLSSIGEPALDSYLVSLRAVTAQRDLDVTSLGYLHAGASINWCPQLAARAAWRVRACAGGELGWDSVSAQQSSEFERRRHSSKLSLAAVLDLMLVIDLGADFSLALEPGLLVPVTRREYVIESWAGNIVRTVSHAAVMTTGTVQVGYVFN